ncbi:pancreatic triacylglycerol lipase [Anabrus simplex]|uniref:pancreatic triacylglycerol lipase n=1 Tax=Anabrus simplex TaxID=316456 RepID=UPI0035A33CCF
MKVLSVFFTGLSLVAVFSHPTETPRFMLMPDGDGKLHLVDLEQTEEVRAINPVTDIKLLVYTRNNPTSPQYIRIENNEVASNFNPSAQTRIVSHGWNNGASNMDHIRAAYMADSSTNYNVILVDWSGLANTLYTTAKSNALQVGEYIAKVVTYLIQKKGANANNIRLVGHSLGAQLSGVAGNRLGGILPMITGLDPAAPLFGSESLANRLDSTDAKFVQVIHTCAGLLGWKDPMGHVDFYPNKGEPIQPGCGVDLGGACSHGRSHQYFAESITTNKGFRGYKCSNWNNYNSGNCNQNQQAMMGEKVSHSVSGSFYLKTANSSPYALG